MLYETKQGTKAYEYIKGILEAEEKEYQAYMKRVDEKLDKKLWREVDSQLFDDGRYVCVAPNKRYKQGKTIAAVLASYKAVTNHFKILKELNIGGSQGDSISITQLLRCKDRIFAFFDDSIRAEKCNSDFTEITIGEYEDLINSSKEG